MVVSGQDKIKQQSKEELARIAQVSMNVRQAVRAALPTPPEQFFTMMVPGKVLNLDVSPIFLPQMSWSSPMLMWTCVQQDYTGGFDSKGQPTAPLPPASVQLAEAILCDDMPVLAGVQLGPTGRSVARSYSATLTRLCPAGQ